MRTVGVACLFAVALLICRMIGEYERRRICESEEMLAFLRAIKCGISGGLLPLSEIYLSHESASLTECGFLLALRRGEKWDAALQKTLLPDGIKNRLAAFGASLGRSRRENEIELCDYYIRELEKELEAVRREGAARQKSHRALTVTATLMLVILLL